MSGTHPHGDLTPGTLFDGKYEIVGLLGAGGMGEVYKARHLHLHAFRCIKVMRPALFMDNDYKARFLREARLATQIHHPNIAVVHDFSVLESGASYMVTEFIDGTTLRQWSGSHGRFPIELAAEVVVQVLSGLDLIHRRGLLHRDISADNVMLAYDGDDRLVVKIIDLGVAKDVGSTDTMTTQAGMLIGNPKYMSPEQLGELPEGEHLDGRADLYCLGVVLYEMLTGVPPFVAKTANGYIIKHLTQPPPPLRESVPDLDFPPQLEAVLMRALEKDRRRRFADAREFALAIAPFANSGGTFTRQDMAQLTNVATQTLAQSEAVTIQSDAATTQMSEEESFQTAWEDGTSTAWEHFLDAFPDGKYADRAQDLLAEAAAYESADSITAIREFLRLWPDSRLQLEAEIRLVAMKRAAAEPIAFEKAATADTSAAWDVFLEQCEDSPRVAEARARRDAARLREIAAAEPADWDRAWESGSSSAWDTYLAAHADSRRAFEARMQRQEAQEFELASQLNTPQMWRAFLKAWPEGRHRLDAEVRLRG